MLTRRRWRRCTGGWRAPRRSLHSRVPRRERPRPSTELTRTLTQTQTLTQTLTLTLARPLDGRMVARVADDRVGYWVVHYTEVGSGEP